MNRVQDRVQDRVQAQQSLKGNPTDQKAKINKRGLVPYLYPTCTLFCTLLKTASKATCTLCTLFASRDAGRACAFARRAALRERPTPPFPEIGYK